MYATNEIWKPIQGYENSYAVSNLGRVMSLARSVKFNVGQPRFLTQKILKPSVNENGYHTVVLQLFGRCKKFKVHRLVLCAFNADGCEMEVNHKNGIKGDNRLDNLEWCTRKENMQHAHKILGIWSSIKQNSPFKKGEDHVLYGKLPHNSRKVKCDTLDVCFDSYAEAESKLGVYKGGVYEIIKGKRTHINGLSFRLI